MEEQELYFDRVAEQWDTMVCHDDDKIETLLKLIPFKENWRVLDIGSGTGILVPFLLKRLAEGELIEMDLSENMLKVAAAKYEDKRLGFVCGDAVEEHKELGQFHAIIAYSMFPHLENKKEAIKSLIKKLNPGGVLAVLHSQSRDSINKMHGNMREESLRADILPTAQYIAASMEENQCKVIQSVDTRDLFAVVGQKKSC